MRAFACFSAEVRTAVQASRATGEVPATAEGLLDGRASAALRELVPLEHRRKHGAFFSGSKLTSRLTDPILTSWTDQSVVWDPACGAGDLLLPFVARIRQGASDSRILGRDLHPEFVNAARWRLRLAALSAGGQSKELPRFRGVTVGSGLSRRAPTASATHVVVNPPFVSMLAPPACAWGDGTVNSAAVFIDQLLEQVRPGAMVAAVVPDVLRSGSRYHKWRGRVADRAAELTIETYGRFDRWTDIDVALLWLRAGTGRSGAGWTPRRTQARVADKFTVSVGAVVNYRDALEGPDRAYLVSSAIPPGGTIRRILQRRRFGGRVDRPPFVAVARTSRPGERIRPRCAVVLGDRPVAVDNHVIVLRPVDGTVKECDALIDVLVRPATAQWLDTRIRCRHLTVESLLDLPLDR